MRNSDLVRHLKRQNKGNASFLDRIKINYRPYICPFASLLKRIEKNKSLFDIGCGSGMFLSLIKEYRSPIKLGGVEIAEPLIQNARNLLATNKLPVELNTYDGISLPESIADYDYVSLIDVLHHIDKNQQIPFLNQVFKKMKPGSILLLKDIDGASILKYWNKFHDWVISREIGHEIPVNTLIKLVDENNQLKLASYSQERMFLYPHFTLVVKKKNS